MGTFWRFYVWWRTTPWTRRGTLWFLAVGAFVMAWLAATDDGPRVVRGWLVSLMLAGLFVLTLIRWRVDD